MEKDYARWHQEKRLINAVERPAYFHVREVWMRALGANIGHEQDGDTKFFSRPVVVLAKFSSDTCLVVPLTSKWGSGKYRFSLGAIAGRDSIALLSQIRLIDRRRLLKKMTTLNKEIFLKLSQRVVGTCFPDYKFK